MQTSIYVLCALLGISSMGCAAKGGATSATAAKTPVLLPLPATSARITFEGGGKTLILSIAANGTVAADGKELGTITGNDLVVKGKTSMRVAANDALVGANDATIGTFRGEGLTMANGATITFAADGTLTMTSADGKNTMTAKTDGVGIAKRAALVVVAAWFALA